MNQYRMSEVVMGAACVTSGLAMCLQPRAMTAVYGLPRSGALAVVLGARDIVIGAGLLRAPDAKWWWRARAASDALDGVLIAARRLVGDANEPVGWTIVRVAAAMSLATYAGRGRK